jgi:hypothetical protein
MINDKRLGLIQEDKVLWPETTISGVKSYGKPATTVFFGNNLFAVVDVFIDKQKLDSLILELQEIANKQGVKKTT